MDFKDYYAGLGVSDSATPEDIKRAYRQLARKYHPDVSKEQGAEARFQEVGEVYEVLQDPAKRAEYDQLRRYHTGRDGSFSPPPGWQSASGFGGGYTEVDSRHFSEFFEQMFGGGSRNTGFGGFDNFSQSARSRGEDVHARLALFLECAEQGPALAEGLKNSTCRGWRSLLTCLLDEVHAMRREVERLNHLLSRFMDEKQP